MAKITMIAAQQHPGRYNVYLNGRFALAVAESVLVKYRLARGMEVDDQLLAALKADDRVAKAYVRMLDYLAHQLRTKQEVLHKLQSLGIAAEDTDQVIARLTDQGLLNDQEYANAYVRTVMRTELKGPRAIQTKLRLKGLDDQKISTALKQFTLELQEKNARKLAQKLYRRYRRQPERRQEQKVMQGLITSGYSNDIYQDIKAEIKPEFNMDDQAKLLDRDAIKAWRHYRHDTGYTKRMKVKRRLASKGYSFDEIDRWFDDHNLDN